jgi:hypothetical protein
MPPAPSNHNHNPDPDPDHDAAATTATAASRSPFDPRLFAKLVYLCVRQVPKGRVATYGLVARLCHHPRHSRHVGKALRALPGAFLGKKGLRLWMMVVCVCVF